MLTECVLSYVVQVSTHLCLLPGVWVCWRKKERELFVLSLCTLFVSFMYHIAEVINNHHCFVKYSTHKKLLLGMTDGQWHRLDNVFAILSIQYLCVFLSDLAEWKHGVGLLCMAFTFWCQEIGPWKLVYTMLPVTFPLVFLLFRGVVGNVRMSRKSLWVGLVALVPAGICFAKGLDDDRDYLRIWHGGWHVFANIACSCFVMSKV
jgi:Protein of unknown function (DUF3522)